MPHLQSIVDEYEGDVGVLALNFRDDEGEALKHYQKASRKAPFWAAQLRLAIDKNQPQP